jgi:hypothetical protein
MASLRNIMNLDVDDDHASSHSLKGVVDSRSRPSQHLSPSSMGSSAYPRDSDYSITTSPSRNQGYSPPTRSLNPLPLDQHSSSMSYGHPGSRHSHDRRQSNASADSMESNYGQGQAYGHGHSGSFSTTPMRPFAPPQEVPVKLTPITGRVSRARKGVPVHTCEICRPPKVTSSDKIL